MRRQARSTAWAVSLFACLAATSSQAGDLIWEVESPFRFFKASRSFALHEAAFNAVRGDPSAPLPADIVWRTERALNDPDCKDASTPDRCAATAGKRYQQSRLGWAAQTLDETCYESNGRPRRYAGVCERKYSWGTAKEDYVLPEAHTVAIRIAPGQLAGVSGDCIWTWQPRKAGGKTETKRYRLHRQAHHCARALCARSRQVRCLGHGQAARRPRARRATRSSSRTSSSWRSAIPLPPAKATRTGRCNSAPSARWCTIRPCCARTWRRERRPSRGAGLRPRLRRRSAQSEGAAAAADGRRGGRALPQAFVARVRRRIRKGVGALAEPRLPSLAIWLSVPRGDRACAREPPSLGDAGELHLLGRGGDRWAVSRHGSARGRRARSPAARFARSSTSSATSLCRGARSQSATLYAAGLRAWQHADLGAEHHQGLVPAAISASARSTWC